MNILMVGIGGFLGAILRFAIILLVEKIALPIFIATLLVNVLGSFLMGLFSFYFISHAFLHESVRYFLITGFLGALTTFSAFSFENFLFLQKGQFLLFLTHLVFNVFLCIVAIYFSCFLIKIIK